MMMNDAAQQIEKIAQERGVSMERIAKVFSMSKADLLHEMNFNMTAFTWQKIIGVIQDLSPNKGIIKSVNPFGKFVVEKVGSVTDAYD